MSKEKLKVLIVEDNEDDLALLLRELNKGKYEIEYELAEDFKSFETALNKKWDVIISDYSLPSFNGFEALKICIKKDIETPFIIVSGTVGEDLAVEMMKAGCKDYIMKKSLKRLLPAVEREIVDANIRKEKKQAEKELMESEDKYRILVENMGEGISITDEFENFVFVNPAAEKIFGVGKGELDGESLKTFLLGGEFEKVKNRTKERRKGKREVFEEEITLKDRSKKILFVHATPWFENNNFKGTFAIFTDITERKWAEDNLRKSEEHYRTLLNAIPDLMFRLDGEGRFIDYHADDSSILFAPPEKFLGKHYEEILPPDISLKYEKSIKEVKKSGEIGKFEYEALLPNNITRFYEARITCFGDECVSIIRDVTEQKNAEKALVESENKYRTIFENVQDIFYQTDINGIITEISPSVEKYATYKREEIIGKPVDIFYLNPIEREIFLKEIKEKGKVTDYEINLVTQDGITRNASVSAHLFFDANKNPIGIEGSLRDISERKKSEASLRESEERFRKIFEDSPFGIALSNKDFIFTRVNSEFCKMMGYSEKEICTKTFKDITHPEHLEQDVNYMKMLSTGEISNYQTEKRYIRKDKKIVWGEINISVIRDNKGEFLYYLAMIENITTRKLAEEAVKESEEHFRNIVNTAEAAYFRINKEGLFEEVNQSWLKMHKYSLPEEIIGKHFETTQIDQDIEKAKENVSELLKGKPIETGEFSRKCKDGSVGYHTFSISPVIENGQIAGIEGFLIDITEQKKTLEALKASQERYRTLIETMNEGVILVDNDDKIQFINRRGCDLYGFEPEELIGKIGYEILEDKEYQEIIKHKNKLRLTSVSDSYEVVGKKKNGEKIWININGAPVKDNEGNVIGSVGILTDITERKHAEEELKKLSRAVEQSPASIVITDTNGNIEYVNPKFVVLTGYLPEEVIGSNPKVLKSGETPESEYKNLWDTILSGKDWMGEFHNKKKNGELYWESALVSPIKNSDGKITHFVAIKEDITEKKLKEIELINAKEKAEESERLKSSFLANMSHELRTPMVGILGFAELMSDMADNKELKDFAENIIKSGKRLLETLNLILDLSRLEAGKLEIKTSEVDVVQLSKEVYGNYIPEIEKKNLKIKFSASEEQIICKVDERMLWESINNLINNAIKYTKTGEIKIDISSDKNKKKVYIKVSDTGIGIPKESLETVFEEFRQVSEGYSRGFEGTGLGLTITKNFVLKNGGKIYVESEIGIGSVFTIELPVLKSLSISSETNEEDIKTTREDFIPEKRDIQLLCVDDDSFTREYLDYILKNVYNISFAENGFTAIEMTKSRKFSLILMDINLGKGMDGIETTRKIRMLPGYENVPIIAMTAFAMKGDREEFINGGMEEYISKPFKSNELIKMIEKVLKIID